MVCPFSLQLFLKPVCSKASAYMDRSWANPISGTLDIDILVLTLLSCLRKMTAHLMYVAIIIPNTFDTLPDSRL